MPSRQSSALTVVQPEVEIWDPHLFTDERDRLSILAAMLDALVQHGDSMGWYQPALASEWTVDPDARTWTFRLRDGVRFHNGQLLRPSDVVASLERARAPERAPSIYRTYLQDARLDSHGSDRVRIVMPEPTADLLDLLASLPIVPESELERLPSQPVGTGSYRLGEVGDGRVVTEAFADGWRGRPAVERITWVAEGDPERRVEQLLSGEADLISGLTLPGKERIETAGTASIVTVPDTTCVIFFCNAAKGPCADPRVRQALNLALDKVALIEEIHGGEGIPLNGPLTPLHLGYDPETSVYPYDPDRARSLLTEAGYPDGLTLMFDVPTKMPDESPELARAMARQYRAAGITIEIEEFTDRRAYEQRVRTKQINDACCFDSTPLSTYRLFREKIHSGWDSPWNQGYSNPDVDALIDQASATIDVAERQRLYRQAYRQVRDDAPWIFLYAPVVNWGVGERAAGWAPDVEGLIRLG